MRKINILCSLFLLVHFTACEERSPFVEGNSSKGESVVVSLPVDIAEEEDGYSLPMGKNTRNVTEGEKALNVSLTPDVQTRTAGPQPDALYELHILQFDRSGNQLDANGAESGSVFYVSKAELGSRLTLSLTKSDDCQLVVIARGEGNTTPAINGNLATIQNLTMDSNLFSAGIPASGATQAQINKMPYALYLPHVKVDENGVVQSVENATDDIRLQLKRLAVKVTLNWEVATELTSKKYALKEVRVCQVPKVYSLLAKEENTEWGKAYPSAMSDFINPVRLTGDVLNACGGKTSFWMPANVRGSSPASGTPLNRTKENAPTASTYTEFVVTDETGDKCLYYRAYLGSANPMDFNLRENTDYNWKVNMITDDYTIDPRIQYIDQSPVESNNLVNTANCLMLLPGGNICFNPYRHTSGTNGWNDHLINTPQSTPVIKTAIDHVRVLWQTKDAVTTGDLVLGYVKSDLQHENLVNIKNGGNKDEARISVKAPVTKGGNALIAAYDVSGKILWSWHIWITDYVPKGMDVSLDYATAQKATKGGSVHQYANTTFQAGGIYFGKVSMDRNLGASAGWFPGANASQIEFSRRGGFIYEWGRKEPTLASVDGTGNEKGILFDGFGNVTEIKRAVYSSSMNLNGTTNAIQYTIENPMVFVYHSASWYNGTEDGSYSNLWSETKTIYDPCPDGWKVPRHDVWNSITVNNAYWFNSNGTFSAKGGNHTKGGRMYNLSGANDLPSEADRTIHNTCWFPVTGYRYRTNGAIASPTVGYLFANDIAGNKRAWYSRYQGSEVSVINSGGYLAEAICVRCVQE